jgi:pimeloyl-ACP methyl ester carboxylesterase
MVVQPFQIQVPFSVLQDLQQRLERTRWPDEIPGSGWDYGTNLDYLKELVEYWRNGFDWPAQERLLNSFPQFKADVNGLGIHFVHQEGKGPKPLPLILIHGWPGSFFEMYKVLGPLSDPASYGGDPADAFHVVVPSLPGYGFSDHPQVRGMNVAQIADLFAKLMSETLGYLKFGAQGGDWGSAITTNLAYAYPESVIGIHLNMVSGRFDSKPESERTEADRESARQRQAFAAEETGYSAIQGTKPQTLAYGLNDSPAGLAAWIVEKFRRWSDCDGDVERVYTKDELLTNIMIYWVTETINSSTRLYYEARHTPTTVPRPERVEVPTGAAIFPKELARVPREAAERLYNIQHWTEMPSGGHFAALEKPQELVNDIRAFFRPLRE